ncbi:MAG: hypothetical protein J1E62_06520 [Lachnospiraceae bacterium]|nr:hypothetical protein [Lachnospiraceae bacterium]
MIVQIKAKLKGGMKAESAVMIRQCAILVCNVLFLLCITFVLIQVFFHNNSYDYNKFLLLAIGGIVLFVLEMAYRLVAPRKESVERYFPFVLGGYLLVMFILEVTFGIRLRFTPVFDMSAVYDGAIEWMETGAIENYREYFHYFPNNIGLLTFLRVFFSLGKSLGITDYFLIGVILGASSLTIMMFSLFMVCRIQLGVEYAILAMMLTAFCFPLYFSAAAFYSDVMSMAAPVLYYLLYLYSEDMTSRKKRFRIYVGMALVAGIGMEIKFTVLIMVIAVMIEMILKANVKNIISIAVIHVVVIAMVLGIVNSVFYPELLDKEQARIMNTPVYHWIMMGARGDGRYNSEDYEFSRSFSDPEVRNEAIKEEIRKRYSEMGLSGYMDFLKHKTVVSLGDGTYAISDFLNNEPVNRNVLHDFILYESPEYGNYRTLCQGVFILIYMLMFAAGVGNLMKYRRNKKWVLPERDSDKVAPLLAFVGLWMFLMMWESSGRYFSNYISVMLLCAVWGIACIKNSMKICR